MRNLFLLILLINLLAFAYQRWILEPGDPVEATFVAQDVPELVVAIEPVVEPPAPVDEPAEEVVSVAEVTCMRIGPFATKAGADAVQNTLRLRNAVVRQSTEQSRVWIGYWVQTAGQGSRRAAEKVRESLIAGGMPDVYVLSAELEYRISLGVFRLRESADTVVRDARQMGVDTRVIERYQEGENFWLAASIASDRSLQPGDLRTDSDQILRTESISCADAAL
jgi:hypothetical protein